jgi:uncharacterized membrane protein
MPQPASGLAFALDAAHIRPIAATYAAAHSRRLWHPPVCHLADPSQASQTSSMSNDIDSSTENVLLVTFGPDPSKDPNAYQALTDLKTLDSQKQVEVVEAAVIERDLDGHLNVKSETGDQGYIDTTTGGVLGVLIGVLGGPVGVLVGGAAGLLAGTAADEDASDEKESVLEDISKNLHPTRTAVITQVSEPSPEVIDTAMARVGGSVLRRPVDDVEAEIAAAEDAEREAQKEARKRLRKARHDKDKAEIRKTVDDLKSKLHHGDRTPTSS